MDDHNELRKPIKDLVQYELNGYIQLAKRMDELMEEYKLQGKYKEASEAEIKRNCYKKFARTLKSIID